MLCAHGPQFWRFLSRHSFPYHHWIPRDLNLSASLAWIPSAPFRAQCEVARARLPNIQHRHPLAAGQVSPVRYVTAYGEQTSQPIGCTAVGCERCDTRGEYKCPLDGPWVCITGHGASDVDGNAIRHEWLSCLDPDCAGHGGI